jgi:lysophospholipase L1-like esterase
MVVLVTNTCNRRRRARRLSSPVLGLALIALATGACDRMNGDVTGPTPVGPPAGTTAIYYSAIGASDANGAGSSVPCFPFSACDDGMGYVPVLVRQLRATRQVTVLNLGIPATVLGPAVEAIARQIGREVTGNFLERMVPSVARESTLVTVFGGVNDANVIGDAIEQGLAGADIPGYIDTQARAFASDYARVISGIRSRAPASFIIVVNVPNAAAMPFAAKYPIEHRRVLQTVAVALSRESNRQAGQGVLVVDVMCNPVTYLASHFASDGFHPNDAGHAEIARQLKAIVDGGSSSPASSCAMMTAIK